MISLARDLKLLSVFPVSYPWIYHEAFTWSLRTFPCHLVLLWSTLPWTTISFPHQAHLLVLPLQSGNDLLLRCKCLTFPPQPSSSPPQLGQIGESFTWQRWQFDLSLPFLFSPFKTPTLRAGPPFRSKLISTMNCFIRRNTLSRLIFIYEPYE